MIRLNFKKRKCVVSTVTVLLILGFVITPLSPILEKREAKAQTVFDPINYIANFGTYLETAWSAASDAASAASLSSVAGKELIGDGIAWQLINIVLKGMVQSITKWVASGFKGSPAFVTDFEGFMTDVADKVAGNFIWGNKELRFLCSPYALNIKLALDIQYRATRAYEAQCTISGIIKNTDQFLAGDFLQGGWDGWYEVALNPQNNVYGAMLEAQQGLNASIGTAQLTQKSLLDFGNGFFSVKDPACKPVPGETDDYFDDSKCGVVTPGKAVETQLNMALGSGLRRVELADEINELIGALFSQLAGEALSGAGGLLGLNSPSPSYGGYSYFDQVIQERDSLGHVSESNVTIETSIADETKYLNLQKSIVTLITDARTYKDRRYPDREVEDDDGDVRVISQCSAGALTASLAQKLTNAERAVASSTALIARLTVYASEYNSLNNESTPVGVTNTLVAKYGATSIPGAKSILMGQYFSYQSSGVLHTAGDMVRLELSTIPDLQKEIQTFTNSIDEDCDPDEDND